MIVVLGKEQLVEDEEVLIAVLEGSPGVLGDMDGVVLLFELRADAGEQVVERVEDLPHGGLLVEDEVMDDLDLEVNV